MLNQSLVTKIEQLIKLTSSTSLSDVQDRSALLAQLRDAALRTRTSMLSRGDFFEAAETPIKSSSVILLVKSSKREQNPTMRTLMFETLGDVGDESAVLPLSLALPSVDEEGAVAAAASLGEIGGFRATQALINIAFTRSTCERGLAAINALEGLATKTRLNGSQIDQSFWMNDIKISLLRIASISKVDQVIRTKAKSVLDLVGLSESINVEAAEYAEPEMRVYY